MTTYEAIKALKEANKSQSRLIVKLRERNGELEDEINSLRMQNSVLIDIAKVPLGFDKKPELTLEQKWEMSLDLMKGLITELYGDRILSDKPNQSETENK